MTIKLRGPVGDPLKGTGSLPDPWVDGHDYDDTAYETTALTTSGIVCGDPESRVGAVYAENQDVAAPASGEMFLGIGCAWRPTPYNECKVSLTWTGTWDDPLHIEAAPLLHVVPGTATHGIGAWTSVLFDAPVVYVGTIGNPPELFNEQLLDVGSYAFVDGTSYRVEVRSNGTGITVWIDGVQVSLTTYGTDPVPIPHELRGSRLHGFAYDSHLATVASIPTTAVLYDWKCEAN